MDKNVLMPCPPSRRDKQIEDMKQGMAQLAKAVAVKEENNGTTDKTRKWAHALPEML